jgi:hypothetical protein
MTIDITPEAVERLINMRGFREVYAIDDTLRALSAALERSEKDCLEAFRRRDDWKAKAEGFDAVRLALREKIGSPWPPSLSRALWAGIAADEKARADTAEAALTASKAETAAAWLPIETAPRDDTEILTIRSNGYVRNAKWYDNPFGRKDTVIDDADGKWWTVTHWMPLPPPPERNAP